MKSRGFVTELFSWQWYYWYLTNEGIEYLREYLHLPQEIVPNTLKKTTRPTSRPGAPSEEGSRPPRFGDRDGYRGGKGGDGDKKPMGAPGDYRPEYRGFGRGGGAPREGGKGGGFGGKGGM